MNNIGFPPENNHREEVIISLDHLPEKDKRGHGMFKVVSQARQPDFHISITLPYPVYWRDHDTGKLDTSKTTYRYKVEVVQTGLSPRRLGRLATR